MKKRKYFGIAAGLLAAFALWTACVRTLDVQSAGPMGSKVGMASLNAAFHRLTGVCPALYTLTDLLSVIPLGIAAGFGLRGLWQWIRRRRLAEVDRELLVLGGFYLAVLAAYGLFEAVPVNFRPVLIDGRLEASYPSSTTVLAICVMFSAAARLKDRRLRSAAYGFGVLMAAGRLMSGVHWLTDVLGGALLSAGLLAAYRAALEAVKKRAP